MVKERTIHSSTIQSIQLLFLISPFCLSEFTVTNNNQNESNPLIPLGVNSNLSILESK